MSVLHLVGASSNIAQCGVCRIAPRCAPAHWCGRDFVAGDIVIGAVFMPFTTGPHTVSRGSRGPGGSTGTGATPGTFGGMLLEGINRRHLREFRAEAMAVVLVYAAAGFAYGRHVWMLEAALAARGVLISFADNAYHYGTRLDARLEAMNLRLPRPLAQFVLAFNLHSVHHRHPGLPWYELRSAFAPGRDEFHLGWFTAVVRQLRGPISADAQDLRPVL